MSTSSLLRIAQKASTGPPESRLAGLDSLHDALLLSQIEPQSSISSLVPFIVSSLSMCTGTHSLDAPLISRGIATLLQVIDVDHSARRQIATPTALAVLTATTGFVSDDDTIINFIKLIHKIAEIHPQSILRSGILQPFCMWMDVGILIGEDKVSIRGGSSIKKGFVWRIYACLSTGG